MTDDDFQALTGLNELQIYGMLTFIEDSITRNF